VILLGDIASPDRKTTSSIRTALSKAPDGFRGKRIVCNLEGLISEERIPDPSRPVLFNHPSVIEALHTGRPPILCMANNHTLDLPGQFDSTATLIRKAGGEFAGAARSLRQASEPAVFNDNGTRVVLFNACWDFLLYNHRNPKSGIYVAELDEQALLSRVSAQKSMTPGARIIVFLHWSLDLEILPFPMYRQFSRDLIDAGANLVAGCHAHCVQGGERHAGGAIVYGLGNFFVPHHHFMGGKLVYPEFSSLELALEWDPLSNGVICHWYRYRFDQGLHQMEYLGGDSFDDSPALRNCSPFRGMDHAEYLDYFKQHRRKRFLIPLYADYRQKTRNAMCTRFLKGRAHFARSLARMGLKKWLK
jgi:hypothetical protein